MLFLDESLHGDLAGDMHNKSFGCGPFVGRNKNAFVTKDHVLLLLLTTTYTRPLASLTDFRFTVLVRTMQTGSVPRILVICFDISLEIVFTC